MLFLLAIFSRLDFGGAPTLFGARKDQLVFLQCRRAALAPRRTLIATKVTDTGVNNDGHWRHVPFAGRCCAGPTVRVWGLHKYFSSHIGACNGAMNVYAGVCVIIKRLTRRLC